VGFFGTRSTNTGSSNREKGAAKNRTQKVSKKAKDKVQRDRDNDSRKKLDNYKVKKLPAIIPGSTILNALTEKVRQKTFEVNRDYYREKVVGKPGYKDTFEDYEKYITGRGQGNLDAMGRTINTGGGGRDNPQGIEIAKAATGTATTTGPNEIQRDATNTITTKDAKKNTTAAILVANKRKSRKSTINTSATGLAENYTLAKKKLLG